MPPTPENVSEPLPPPVPRTTAEELRKRGQDLELLDQTEKRLAAELAEARRAGDDAAAARLRIRLDRLAAVREQRRRQIADLERSGADASTPRAP